MAAMEAGDYPLAMSELAQAAHLKPQDIEFRKDWLQNRETATAKLLAKADSALKDGRSTHAEQAYRAILQYERDNARAKTGLENLQRTKRAADDGKQAREAFKRGEMAQAAQWVDRALLNAPDQAEALGVKRDIEAFEAKELLSVPNLGALYKKPINLEFRDASLKMVFEALSRTTGINFIFDRDVKSDTRTTVFLKQTALDDAIDVILSTNQLDKKVLNASSVLIYPNNLLILIQS
jgi:general secretion pathway protein D